MTNRPKTNTPTNRRAWVFIRKLFFKEQWTFDMVNTVGKLSIKKLRNSHCIFNIYAQILIKGFVWKRREQTCIQVIKKEASRPKQCALYILDMNLNVWMVLERREKTFAPKIVPIVCFEYEPQWFWQKREQTCIQVSY